MKTQDIDHMIGMPDIDSEWAKFEKEVINQQAHRPWRRVAAVVAIAFCLSAAAAGVWLTVAGGSGNSEVSEISEYSEVSDKNPKADCFVFDNVEMQQVAATLAKHYRLTPAFENENVKRKRIYLKVNKKKTIDEVVEQLNQFEEINVTVSNGKLIIK